MATLLTIVVAAIVSMVIGMIWYGPLFGKKWMSLSGVSKQGKGNASTSYVLGFVVALVTAYVLDMFVVFAGAASYTAGATVGAWAWLGFSATLLLGSVLWEGKSWNLWALNAGYRLVSLAVMGAILAGLAL